MSEFDNEALDILQEKPEESESRSDSRNASPTTVARDSEGAAGRDIVAEDGGADHAEAIKGEILSRRQRDFHEMLTHKLRDPKVSKEHKDLLVTAYKRMDWRDDEELKKLPDFVALCQQRMAEKDPKSRAYHSRKGHWFTSCSEHFAAAVDIIALNKDIRDKNYPAESSIEDMQKIFWYQYNKLNELRQHMFTYFELGTITLSDMIPDRLSLGTFMSEEDFVFFMGESAQKFPDLFKLQKGVNINDPGKPVDEEEA